MNNINKDEIEIKLIKIQIRNESWGFWIKNVVFVLSGIFAVGVYYNSTKPQTDESMNRERVKFMWEVKKEKDPENQAYGWQLIESVYEIRENERLKKIDTETKEDIDSELEIKKQELRRLIEQTNNSVDKQTYRLRLEALEKFSESSPENR